MFSAIVFNVTTAAWLHNVPELSLLTLLSFGCLLRPAEARQLRLCNVQAFNGSLSTRYEKVSGIVRRMAGQAAQQQVLLECLGIRSDGQYDEVPQFLITNLIQQFGLLLRPLHQK